MKMFKRFLSHPKVRSIFWAIISVLTMVSLIGYHAQDNSWNTSSNEAQNYLGPIGAWTADILLQVLGGMAFVFPIVCLIFAVFLWREVRWLKLRLFLIVLGFLWTTWLLGDYQYETVRSWFKAGLGGFVGHYLNRWWMIPKGYWMILWVALDMALFVWVLKIPFGKISRATGKSCWWVLHKTGIKLPAKISVLFKKLRIHHQVEKIKKSAPKSKVKAVKKTPQTLVQKPVSGPQLPSSDLLAPVKESATVHLSKDQMNQISRSLESVLMQFKVQGQVVGARPGPVVTLYEFEPASGIKISRVITLADDVAREMKVVSVRMAVVPGSNVIGIEMPNQNRETVYIREMIEDDGFKNHKGALPIVLGKNIGGRPVFADLAKMPHLLVAGTTGSGKSVGINTMILSLLYRFTPEQCRLIMVDPKMVELSVYNGIPHLLTPVVTEPGKSLMALKWAVHEMEDRYRNMSQLGVRNIEGFNEKLREAKEKNLTLKRRVQTGFDPATGQPIMEDQAFDLTPLPYIVFIIDEMADLMGQCGKEADPLIQRLAQMARAVGIHLILATQRPSVDVVTGTIKSNFPSRISFQVRNKIDSRTILDEQGAEQLLGRGDMLYMPAGNKPTRVHGPFVSDEDVANVVKHWTAQGEPKYLDAVVEESAQMAAGGSGATESGGTGDSLYDQAVAIVLRDKKPTTSYIQRRLSIGYNKAASLIEKMEQEGIVSAPNVAGKREILVAGGE
jgi:S-DNA-T family DNA segregation ATPase FtsK/SpoIIIE